MKRRFLSSLEFRQGWRPPAALAPDPQRLWYQQHESYLDYRRFRGQDYTNPSWSMWDDPYEFEFSKRETGELAELFSYLDVETILSVGSNQAFTELLMLRAKPELRVIASDINIPRNIEKDIARCTEFDFPPHCRELQYIKLDLRQAERDFPRERVDAIFIAATFCVVDDDIWKEFIAIARTKGVRIFVICHAEELCAASLLTLPIRRWVDRRWSKVWLGWLRDKRQVVSIFESSGYRLLHYAVIHSKGWRRLLSTVRIKWSKAVYLFCDEASYHDVAPSYHFDLSRVYR